MLGSMGTATFLLFAAPHSPMAQPWPLLGGNLVSASWAGITRYPQTYPHHPAPKTTPPVVGLELDDIEWAICQMNEGVIDVS